MTKILGAVRLSRASDASTSPERQREVVASWADMNHGQIVHVAEDLDVSGAVSPWERPELGPWLTEPGKFAQWDVLVVWKLDRLSRSAIDTLQILQWAVEQGKRVVAVADSLDSDSSMGRVWIQLAAIFAEVERSNIKERILSSRRHLRSVGRWAGGHAPYGYRPVQDGDGYRLEHDPEEYEVVREAVSRVVAGEAPATIARDLTERGVPAPRARDKRVRWQEGNGAWSPTSLRGILRSPALRGWSRYKGKPVLGSDGLPLMIGPPIVDAGEWEAVQEALAQRSKKPKTYLDAGHSPLFGIVHCEHCGSHMVGSRTREGHRRYVCSAGQHDKDVCPGRSILAEPVEEYAEEQFLRMFGPYQVIEYEPIRGNNYTAELKEIQESLTRLDEAYQAGAFEGDAGTYASMRKGLRGKMVELEGRPTEPDRVEARETGTTYRDLYRQAENAEERRRVFASARFRVWVGPRVRQGRTTREELYERLSAGVSDEALFEVETFE